MTLNYRMIMERYPKMNGVVGCSIPIREIFSLLDGNLLFATHLYVFPKKEIKY